VEEEEEGEEANVALALPLSHCWLAIIFPKAKYVIKVDSNGGSKMMLSFCRSTAMSEKRICVCRSASFSC